MTYQHTDLYKILADLRAMHTPVPRPVMEPAPIKLTEEQFLAVDEQAGITYE